MSFDYIVCVRLTLVPGSLFMSFLSFTVIAEQPDSNIYTYCICGCGGFQVCSVFKGGPLSGRNYLF